MLFPLARAASALSLLAGGVLLAVAPATPAAATPSDCSTYEVVAHRGYHPDGVAGNSMEAFVRGAADGYSLETDIRADAEGVLWVFHDLDTFPSTGTVGQFDQLTTAEVEQLTYRGPAQAPLVRFDDLLTFVATQTTAPLYLEPKVKSIAGEVMQEVLDAGLADRTWLTAYPQPVTAVYPEALQLEKVRGRTPLTADYLDSRGIDIVALLNRNLSPDLVDYYHGEGFEVQAQEANGYRAWHQAIVAGADGQLTDNPAAVETYCPQALEKPVVTDLSPNRGRVGSTITVTGAYFFDVRAVRFADVPTTFTVVDSRTMIVTVPQTNYALTRVVVRNPNGLTRSAERFRTVTG